MHGGGSEVHVGSLGMLGCVGALLNRGPLLWCSVTLNPVTLNHAAEWCQVVCAVILSAPWLFKAGHKDCKDLDDT